MYRGMTRSEMAAEAGLGYCRHCRNYVEDDHCEECHLDSDECECEREHVTFEGTITIRKPRTVYVRGWGTNRWGKSVELQKGDRVYVQKGFTYEPNGPRTGYFTSYRRVVSRANEVQA